MVNFEFGKIHASAIVGQGVKMGNNVTVGAHSIIFDNVYLGDNVTVGSRCILGEPQNAIYHQKDYENATLRIGNNSLVRSGSIIYSGSVIGEGFETGHSVIIRENVDIGHHVRVGTLCDIQGYCRIGDYTRFHSNVHIGQKSSIGNYVWIFPYTVLTNDPHPPSEETVGVTIDDFAVIATKVVILPGVKVGKDALVGAMSLVNSDVPPEAIVVGSPAKAVGNVRKIRSKTTGENVYPWREHFDRGMPWEGIGYEHWRDKQPGEIRRNEP